MVLKTLRAFTLVELLIVVTIILVLLALLTPAIEQAAEEARMAVCASNLDVICITAVEYAANNRQFYPDRPAVRNSQSWWQPWVLFNASYDERPTLKGMINYNKSMNCPMAGQIDLITNGPNTTGMTAYDRWFGFGFPAGNGSGLYRLQDRLEYGDDTFSVLAADRDLPTPAGPWTESTHPDDSNQMTLQNNQEQWNPPYTFTRWVRWQLERGPIDSNYGYSDGSVQLYQAVQWNEADTGRRMARVPYYNSDPNNTASYWSHLPRR